MLMRTCLQRYVTEYKAAPSSVLAAGTTSKLYDYCETYWVWKGSGTIFGVHPDSASHIDEISATHLFPWRVRCLGFSQELGAVLYRKLVDELEQQWDSPPTDERDYNND